MIAKTILTILMIINISLNITAYISSSPITMCMTTQQTPTNENNKLTLRNDRHDRIVNCNNKCLYINYLLTLRSVKKTIKYSANNDVLQNINYMIDNIINVSTTVNPSPSPSQATEGMLSVGSNSIIINDDLIAKKLILANVQVDVSNIKHIQISTKNDTLIIELDKNNNVRNDNLVKYDLKTMDALISAVSIMMNLLNVH